MRRSPHYARRQPSVKPWLKSTKEAQTRTEQQYQSVKVVHGCKETKLIVASGGEVLKALEAGHSSHSAGGEQCPQAWCIILLVVACIDKDPVSSCEQVKISHARFFRQARTVQQPRKQQCRKDSGTSRFDRRSSVRLDPQRLVGIDTVLA